MKRYTIIIKENPYEDRKTWSTHALHHYKFSGCEKQTYLHAAALELKLQGENPDKDYHIETIWGPFSEKRLKKARHKVRKNLWTKILDMAEEPKRVLIQINFNRG